MMNRALLPALLCAIALAVALTLASCQQKAKDPLVKVGKATLCAESMETFKKLAGVYPEPMPFYFPGQRQPITFLTECEAIYQYAKDKPAITQKVMGSLDWAWKKKYYAASLFFDLFVENLGFTNKQLEDHYKKSAEEFLVSATTESGRDSSYLPPLDSIKRKVADSYFCSVHKPDSAFLARLTAASREQEVDSAAIINHWLYSVRSNPGDFYMRLFFKEQTGTEYTDSIEQLVGDGLPIKDADIDVVRNWLRESRRGMSEKDIAEWLYKWHLFSQHAEKLKLTAAPQFKEMLHWAQRIEFAREYLRSKVVPEEGAEAAFSAQDSAIALLTVYDNISGIILSEFDPIASDGLGRELNNIAKTKTTVAVDSAIYAIRKSVKVKFLQDDWRDERGANPAELIARADSLRDESSDPDMDGDEADAAMAEAEGLYRTLSTDFAFSAEGRRAMGEVAKSIVDKYGANTAPDARDGLVLRSALGQAISSYRKAQILDQSAENLCNSSFMIGFTYDEYLRNFSLAEANYKWILANAPGCALASDAEYMLLHIGEPMTSIEEIQGQSMRQGRVVDFDEEVDGGGSVGSAAGVDEADIEAILNGAI